MATLYDAKTLAEFVQMLMDENRFSYEQLAEHSGVGRSTLYRMVNSNAIPKDAILKQLADYANFHYPRLQEIARPELQKPKRYSATTLLIADLVEQLPEDWQQTVLAQIRATVDNRKKQTVKGDK